MESMMTARVGGWEGGGIEQKGKRTHGQGQQCGDCLGGESIRGLNGNGKKNTRKIKSKKKRKKRKKHGPNDEQESSRKKR